LQGAQADIRRELLPVFPQAVDLEVRSHGADPGISKEILDIQVVISSEPGWDEDIKLAAHNFIVAVAEDFLKLGIDQGNRTIRTDKKHGIRGGVKKVFIFVAGLFISNPAFVQRQHLFSRFFQLLEDLGLGLVDFVHECILAVPGGYSMS